MNATAFFRVSVGLVGLLMVGEAVALFVGMHLLSERSNPWIGWKNDCLLGIDLLTGGGLLCFAVMNGRINPFSLVYLLVTLALVAHGYRVWEHEANVPHKFCINLPLFVFNNIKLLGLLAITGILTILKLN
jgi:hypothetical protein